MAKFPDGSFYRVVALTDVDPTNKPGCIAYPLYTGASLQAAEKIFGKMAYYMMHPEEVLAKQPYKGLVNIPRLEIRYFRADGKAYQVGDAWRHDMNCRRIFTLLGQMNHPKFLERLYGRDYVQQRDYDNANKAADLLAPYTLQICYNDDTYWAYWHGHNCKCWFQTGR